MYYNQIDELISDAVAQLLVLVATEDDTIKLKELRDTIGILDKLEHEIDRYRKWVWFAIEAHTAHYIYSTEDITQIPYAISEQKNRRGLENNINFFMFRVNLLDHEHRDLIDDILAQPDQWRMPFTGVVSFDEILEWQNNLDILNSIDPEE